MPTSLYAPDVKVEVAFNAGIRTPKASRSWTDVSDYVEFDQGITIDGGRGDERSTADGNSLSVPLDNSDGRFTPDRASSPHYPNVKLGRPIRVTATWPPPPAANLIPAASASFESGVGAWTAGGTVPPTLTQSAVRAVSGSNSLLVTWGTGGVLPLAQFNATGLTIGVTYTFAPYVWVPTGHPNVLTAVGGGIGVGPSTALKDQWVRLEQTFTATATSHGLQIWPATAPTAGQQVWVDAVMLVAATSVGDFNTVTPTTWVRGEGYVDDWPHGWPEQVDTYARTAVSASSRMVRLGASTKLRALVQEEILALNPAAYYPLNEPDGAQYAAPLSPDDADPLLIRGSGAAVTFGQGGLTADGLTAPSFSGKKFLKANYTASSSAGVTISTFFRNGDFTATGAGELLSAIGVQLSIGSGGTPTATPATGTAAATAAGAMPDNEWHHLAARLNAAGSTITVWVDGIQVATASPTAHTPSGKSIIVGNNDGTLIAQPFRLAHVAIWATALADADILAIATAGLTGYTLETAAARLARFAEYAGVAAAETSFDAAATTPIAHVNPAGQAYLEPMRTVEETEGGVLFDSRDNTLTYISRNARPTAVSAVSLSMLTHQVGAGVAPRYDRSGLVNDCTATLVDGTTVRIHDQGSIDDYDPAETSVDLASLDPVEAASAAGWRVSTYGEPRTRIPNLTVDLTDLTMEQAAAVLALDVGDLITVTDWPTQAASSTQSFFVEGYNDRATLESYEISFNVSPAGPWLATLILDDATRGVLDTNTLAY